MPNSPVCRVVFTWRDREGNRADTTMCLLFSRSLAEAKVAAADWRAVASALSDAVIVRTRYYWEEFHFNDYLTAGPSLFPRKLLLFYKEADRYEAFAIGAPKASIFETTGAYAGYRTDAANVPLQEAMEELRLALLETVTRESETWPTVYLVGGLVI